MRWIILCIAMWLLAAYLASSCSGNLLERTRAECERSGGVFTSRTGTASNPEGEWPAVLMLCVYKGRVA